MTTVHDNLPASSSSAATQTSNGLPNTTTTSLLRSTTVWKCCKFNYNLLTVHVIVTVKRRNTVTLKNRNFLVRDKMAGNFHCVCAS